MEMHAHTQMESLTQPHIHPVGQCPDCDSARERDFARERERERKEKTSYTPWCMHRFTHSHAARYSMLPSVEAFR